MKVAFLWRDYNFTRSLYANLRKEASLGRDTFWDDLSTWSVTSKSYTAQKSKFFTLTGNNKPESCVRVIKCYFKHPYREPFLDWTVILNCTRRTQNKHKIGQWRLQMARVSLFTDSGRFLLSESFLWTGWPVEFLRIGAKINGEGAANKGCGSLFAEGAIRTLVVTSLGAILDSQFSSLMIRHGRDRKHNLNSTFLTRVVNSAGNEF